MKYFDSHAHYTDRKYNKDRDELLQEMHRGGVAYIVNSTSHKDLKHGLQMADKYKFIYLSIVSDDYYKEDADIELERVLLDELFNESVVKLKKLCAQNKKIVAYGEFGMDFRRVPHSAEEERKQAFWMRKDCEMARILGLPVVIHSGNACQQVFDVLKAADMPDYGHGRGMIHCYLGSPQMAMDYIAMGYKISVTGLVTHRSARGKNLAETVKLIPLSHMIIETDCPYLTPEPFRNERNDSGFLRLVVEKIAEIKGVHPEEAAEITTANAKAFYRIT